VLFTAIPTIQGETTLFTFLNTHYISFICETWFQLLCSILNRQSESLNLKTKNMQNPKDITGKWLYRSFVNNASARSCSVCPCNQKHIPAQSSKAAPFHFLLDLSAKFL
jgi:hypothetical protein